MDRPDTAEALERLAAQCDRAGRPDEAAATREQALAVNPRVFD